MSNYISGLGNFKEHFDSTFEESLAHLRSNPALTDKLNQLDFIAQQVLFNCAPADLEALTKLGGIYPLPLMEAGVEFAAAQNLAIGGMYKGAFIHLRNFVELHTLSIYLLNKSVTEPKAQGWVQGKTHTPQWRVLVRGLFAEPNFQTANVAFAFLSSLNACYWTMSDFVHTKGARSSSMHLSRGNVPSFVAASLESFARTAECALMEVCTAHALSMPILSVPLPMWEKFGPNPPMSGFLDEDEGAAFRQMIGPARLKVIDTIAAADGSTQELADWIRAMPTLAEVELLARSKKQKEQLGPRSFS